MSWSSTGGHALIEGVPGLAKTLAVKCLAHIFNLQFQRVQCTPDLIPADILGGNIFQPADGTFRMNRGPVFTDLLLVDEINRMPPRTQSALLESMEEFQVTIDGVSYPLSRSRLRYSPRRIRWNSKAHILCRKRSSTVS